MSSRPSKRPKTSHHLVPVGPRVVKLLTKLSKAGLAQLSLSWASPTSINQPIPNNSDRDDRSNQPNKRSAEEVYAALADSSTSTKAELLERIQSDWASHHNLPNLTFPIPPSWPKLTPLSTVLITSPKG